MQPTTVVFDIGNVLLRWDMRNLFQKLIADETRLDWFMANVCPMAWHATLDAGRPYADAVAERIALFPEEAALIEAYDARWQETIDGAIEGAVALLHELRGAGVPTYAITNFPAEKFDETCDLYPFLRGFRGVVVSGRERLVKPGAAIFELFLSRYGLEARDCLFIDDSPANVAAAQALGFTAVRFVDPPQLRVDLARHGLPVASAIAAAGAAS